MQPPEWQLSPHTEDTFAELATWVRTKFKLGAVHPATWIEAPESLATQLSGITGEDTHVTFGTKYQCSQWISRAVGTLGGNINYVILTHLVFPEALICKPLWPVKVTGFIEYLPDSDQVVAKCIVKDSGPGRMWGLNMNFKPSDTPRFAADNLWFECRNRGHSRPELDRLTFTLPSGEIVALHAAQTLKQLALRLAAGSDNYEPEKNDSSGYVPYVSSNYSDEELWRPKSEIQWQLLCGRFLICSMNESLK